LWSLVTDSVLGEGRENDVEEAGGQIAAVLNNAHAFKYCSF
jgi:hypothetical protein